MSQQDRDALEGDSLQQQFDSECVPEPVTVHDAGQLEHPIRFPGPEEILPARRLKAIERVDDESR
jgi:hypothetical protein